MTKVYFIKFKNTIKKTDFQYFYYISHNKGK